MKKDKTPAADAAELRRRAEARLVEDRAKSSPGQAVDDVQRLVHELQVHQIELEMQNEELRRSRAEVETLLERYTGALSGRPCFHAFICGSDEPPVLFQFVAPVSTGGSPPVDQS